MDIKDIIESNISEDGTIDFEAINTSLDEKMITKEDATKQTQAVALKTKKKYSSQIEELKEQKQTNGTEDKKVDIDLDTEINKRVEEKLKSFESSQEEKAKLNKALEAVKPEFREFVGHMAQNTEGFNMDEYLKENSQFVDKVTTQSNLTRVNTASEASEHDKTVLSIIDNL